MSELLLTQAEIDAETYLEWDNETIANQVRKLSGQLNSYTGQEAITMTGYAQVMVFQALEANSDISKITIDGLNLDNKSLGNWVVTVERQPPIETTD